MKIFSGSSNQDLAKKIAEIGKWDVGQVESSKFENGERRIKVGKGSGQAVVVQSLSQNVDEHLIEFCLLCDALSRSGYTDLTGVIPWMGYSKQDKVFLPGEALSAKVVAQIIQTTKIKKLITFDLHNRAITGFFEIPVIELSAKPILLNYFKQFMVDGSWHIEDTVVVAPDAGSVKSSGYFARELGVSIAYMDKRRDLKTGKVEVVGMSGEVRGKPACAGRRVIIVDDMIVTGATMMASATYLKKMGAKSVSVAATHHLYVPGAQDRLEESEIDEVVVSDTVGNSQKSKVVKSVKSKLKILSVAGVVVGEL